MIDINNYFSTLTLIVGLVIIISGYLNTHLFKNAHDLKIFKWTISFAQLVSWIVSIIICYIGHVKNIGFLKDSTVGQAIADGVGVALISNGTFDINIIKAILSFVGAHKQEED